MNRRQAAKDCKWCRGTGYSDWACLSLDPCSCTFPAPFLVGLTGPAGSGKSTVARALVELAISRGYVAPVQLHIGATLKVMLGALYASAGLQPPEIWERVEGSLKRAPCAILGGRTPTDAQQTLGTDWGRDLIAPDLWLGIWRKRAAGILPGCSVINESVRFENEATAIRDLGGIVIGLTGRAGDLTGSAAGHVSEAGVRTDYQIPNDGTPKQTAENIFRLLS